MQPVLSECSTRHSLVQPQCRMYRLPARRRCDLLAAAAAPSPVGNRQRHTITKRLVTCTYPEPETEKERSPIDIPQEWITPQPSRRPDIFPEWEKLETPMPKPMPGDPEVPDEEEEEEKKKKDPKKDPEEEPEKKPEEPAPSE